jgi:acyl-CoA thioester hydrolase
MDKYIRSLEVRWSDLDPNFHLRHSVYYDWGAFVRFSFLNDSGITPALLMHHHMGPILFREECVFRKEVGFSDKITLDIQIIRARRDASRWAFRHEVVKNGDTVAAVLTVEGAWMDTVRRKLAAPPKEVQLIFEQYPKSAEFTWEEMARE